MIDAASAPRFSRIHDGEVSMQDPDERVTQPTPTPVTPKRLYRSSDQKMFLGVCGGLAEYFDMDPTIVRLLFVLGALLGGVGVVLYVVLALIMPAEDMLDTHPREAARSTVDEATAEVQRLADQAAAEIRRAFKRS
jgi:phage shock protein PspC (stress-responsive transcriptional regulator)